VYLGKILNAISHLGAKQSTRVVAQPDEKHANRTASVLEDMTDTEHSATSGLNEEEVSPHVFKMPPT